MPRCSRRTLVGSVALTLLLMLACMLMPQVARAEDSGTSGYWKLSDDKPQVITSSNDFAGASGSTSNNAYFYQRSASANEHTESVSYQWYRYWSGVGLYTYDWKGGSWSPHGPERGEEVHTDTAAFAATVSEPPSVVEAGGDCTFTLTLNMVESDCYYDDSSGITYSHLKASTKMVANYDYYLSHGSSSWFEGVEEGEPSGCYVSVDNYAMGGQSIGEPANTTECMVSARFPTEPGGMSLMTDAAEGKGAGDKITVAFVGCGSDTVWTYEWVPGKPAATSSSVTIMQITETDADDKPSTTVIDILPEIEEGVNESDIPRLAAIAGVTVVGGVVITSLLRRKKKSSEPRSTKQASKAKDDEQRREPSKRYRMVVSKDFGNGFRPGGKFREVRVRIEEAESQEGVPAAFHPSELTRKIVAKGVDSLLVRETSMRDGWMCLNVGVPKDRAKDGQPMLDLSYTGKGGRFYNRVKFRLVEDPAIVFANVRGEKLAEKVCDVDALMGDRRGSVFYFGVRDFLGNQVPRVAIPEAVSTPEVTVAAMCEPFELSEDVRAYFSGDKEIPYFRVRVACPNVAKTRYGSWPLSVELPIKVVGDEEEGDVAAASVTLLLWPEGIFFDTSVVYDEGFLGPRPGDRVEVATTITRSGASIAGDKGRFVGGPSSEEDYRLRPTYVGIGAAYKCPGDIVEVQGLNHDPWMEKRLNRVDGRQAEVGTPWTRLEAFDEASRRAFDDNNPRVWYDLRMTQGVYVSDGASWVEPGSAGRVEVAQRMSSRRRGIYSSPARVSFAEVEPLLPLLTEKGRVEYRGQLHVDHSRERIDQEHGIPSGLTPAGVERLGLVCSGDIVFGFTGVEEGAYEAERARLVRGINRLLGLYRIHELDRAQEIFAKYGLVAERVRLRHGTPRQVEELGMTTDALLKEVNRIQSVQRLNFIRQAIFEAGAAYVEGEGDETLFGIRVSYRTLGNYYRAWEIVMTAERWAIDIVLASMWFALLGPDAAYVVPITTPLYDWVLGYADKMGIYLMNGDDDEYVDPREYFTWESCRDKFVYPAIEGELLALFANAVVSKGGAKAALKSKGTWVALGGIGCFFFYKNYDKHLVYDPATRRYELDLWGALKDTMGDFTVFGFKALVSILLSARLAKYQNPSKEGGLLAVPEDAHPFDKGIAKVINWVFEPLRSGERLAGNALTRGIAPVSGGVYPTYNRVDLTPGVNIETALFGEGRKVVALSDGTTKEIWTAFYDAFVQMGVDRTREYLRSGEAGASDGHAGGFESWVCSFGEVKISLGRDGDVMDDHDSEASVSFADAITWCVERLFEMCGIDFKLDLDKRMGDVPPYPGNEKMYEGLRQMEKQGIGRAGKEADSLQRMVEEASA